jgi:hypothetical protein
MNHEVYLRARLADEEKRLEPGMKAAIAWALEEIATWRGMWEVANKRACELKRKEYKVRELTGAMRHVQLICDNATALGNRLTDTSAIALNLVLAIGRINNTITEEIGERPKNGEKVNAD